MPWLREMIQGQSVAGAVLILAAVVASGLVFGSLRFKGLGLGIAGVLFAGLAAGRLGLSQSINEHVLDFMRDFGLVLFVYTIGVQVGPSFLASLRRAGLPLNLMAAAIVLLGAGLALAMHLALRVPMPVVVGLLAGATTNTPSLAAARQALADVQAVDVNITGVGYAVAYPFGIIGIILTMLLMRWLFRISLVKEEEHLKHTFKSAAPRVERMNLEVTNPNLRGLPLQKVPMLGKLSVVISRIYQDGELAVPQPETMLRLGDVLLAVGPQEELEQLRVVVGQESTLDLRTLPTSITSRRLIVTRKRVLGRALSELDFVRRFGVRITRVSRAEIELTPSDEFELQYGDTVLVVGEPQAIDKVAAELGDSLKTLRHPQLIPVFIGIALGVVVGSWPLSLPGVPAPVKLGLAGGPLLVAIILSRIGRVGPLVWYMPMSANYMLREVGIVLFLACVGLAAGDKFAAALFPGPGWALGPGFYWMGLGVVITLVPLLVVALVARLFYKLNYLMLCGLLAGSMTDPPALAFANHVTGSESPSVAYATVYPLTMILRVLLAQLLVLCFMR